MQRCWQQLRCISLSAGLIMLELVLYQEACSVSDPLPDLVSSSSDLYCDTEMP